MRVYLIFTADGTKYTGEGLDFFCRDDSLRAVCSSIEAAHLWCDRYRKNYPEDKKLLYIENYDVLDKEFILENDSVKATEPDFSVIR